jgi:hypothetical protein
VDVGQDTSTSDGGLNELIQFVVGADGEQQVTGVDTLHTHILSGVTSQLQQLGSQILQNSSAVHSSSGSDTTAGVGALLQETMDTSDGELQTSSLRARLGLLAVGSGGGALLGGFLSGVLRPAQQKKSLGQFLAFKLAYPQKTHRLMAIYAKEHQIVAPSRQPRPAQGSRPPRKSKARQNVRGTFPIFFPDE